MPFVARLFVGTFVTVYSSNITLGSWNVWCHMTYNVNLAVGLVLQLIMGTVYSKELV